MGIVSFFAGRPASVGSSERVIGEVVRAMARKGWPAVAFVAAGGGWRVEFLPLGHEVFSAVFVTVGGEAAAGGPAGMDITAQVKHFLADPEALLEFADAELAALAEVSWPGTRVEREHNAVHGTRAVELDAADAERLSAIIDRELGELGEQLGPYSVRC